MKNSYLPQVDRKTLKILRHTDDIDQIACILDEVIHTGLNLQVLWKYKKWLLMLSKEHLDKYPRLVVGLIQIYILQGKYNEATKLLDTIPKDSSHYILGKLMMPGVSLIDMVQDIKRLKEKEDFIQYPMLLTAGRTSVVNGIWDMTPYITIDKNSSIEINEKLIEIISMLYPNRKNAIIDIIKAEALYQRDECYEALVKSVGMIPFLKDRAELSILFATLTLQTYIMVINEQVSSAVPLMENLRKEIISNELKVYIPNIDALDAWSAMYDGDYARVNKWMQNKAPNEYDNFCMLDLFRYMVKIRGYIIQSKHFAVTSLASKILPLLEKGNRYMDMCELHMLWAMSDDADNRKEEALYHIHKAIELSEKYRYDRLIVDEGIRMLELLKRYHKEKGSSPYLDRLIKMSTKTSVIHLRYLKKQLSEKPELTKAQLNVLRLLADCRTNVEIADILDIAVDTVKQHCKHIYEKLEVKNRSGAVQRAVELGIIKPIEYN